MSELLAFAELGLRHITDPRGADHVLFLVALAAVYRLRDWREAASVATAFTIGHSITLALAVSGALALPANIIEFLIPVTIVVTTADNLRTGTRASCRDRGLHRPLLAGTFGLVHGAGFANYLRSLFLDELAVPLFGFNVGLEVGQLVILAVATAMLAAVDRALAAARLRPDAASVLRARAVLVSACVATVSLRWAVERAPW